MTLAASIADAQRTIKQAAERNPDSLADLFTQLDPTTKRVLRNTLVGSLLGGTAGMGAGVMSPEKSVVGSGIAGGLLGGVAGGAGTLGWDLLRANALMPGERDSGPGALVDRLVVDPTAGAIVNNPATAIGGAGGAVWGLGRYTPASSALAAAIERDRQVGAVPGAANSAAQEVADAITRMRGQNNPIGKVREWLNLQGVIKNRNLYRTASQHVPAVRSPWNLAAIPAGLLLGYMVDRYIKGKNR